MKEIILFVALEFYKICSDSVTHFFYSISEKRNQTNLIMDKII